MDELVELAVEVVLADRVVDHRVHAEHEAVGGQQECPRHGDRVAVADAAVALALPQQPGREVGDGLLATAPAGEQVGEQQLGVELDDAHEQLVVAQGPGGRHDLGRQPVGRASRSSPSATSQSDTARATTSPHSRVIRSPSTAGMSGHAR